MSFGHAPLTKRGLPPDKIVEGNIFLDNGWLNNELSVEQKILP
jgi:hypothetical protein